VSWLITPIPCVPYS